MIKNKTKNTIVCREAKILKSALSKAAGLMFSKQISDKGLVFVFEKPRKADLHMLFVFFPIDVILLDSAKKVIELKNGFRPFSFFLSKEKASYVIELPEGAISASKTRIGDCFEF